MEGNVIQYLSNLFTRIVFKNSTKTKTLKVETSDYFDELEIISNDDYITFTSEATGEQAKKSISIGLDVELLESQSGMKMYCYEDSEEDGHIIFSYSPPSSAS